MKIPATLKPLFHAGERVVPSLLQRLQVGQVLSAKVLEPLQPGLLRLQMANTILVARSQVALGSGTPLRLEVTKAYPLPELKILRSPTRAELRQQLVRTALPRQLTPVEVRRESAALAEPARSVGAREPLRQLVGIQRDAGVSIPRLSATQIQRAVAQSGVLHESQMAAGRPPDPSDAKFRLLQLLVQLRPDLQAEGQTRQDGHETKGGPGQSTTPRSPLGDSLVLRLVRLIEGSVARIQLQQATAVPQDDGPRQVWQLDLPLHLGDETQDALLRIEREARGSADGQDPTWAVTLAFQFDSIGRLQCRVTLAGERVSATFWCEQAITQRQIEQRLPSLQEAFEAQGFDVVHLAGVLGDPPEPLAEMPLADTLLDEHA